MIIMFSIPTVVRLQLYSIPLHLVNIQTGFCLSSDGNERVYTIVCNMRAPQWQFKDDGTIRLLANGKCLDSDRKKNVYVKECNGGNFQKWLINIGYHSIRNIQTDYCLDSDTNKKVYTFDCNGGDFQKWTRTYLPK